MRPIDLKNINFPTKKDEEFRKINISKLLENEYKNTKEYKLDFKTIEKSFNEEANKYNELLKINEQLETKTYQLVISQTQEEPIVIIHKLSENDTIYTNNLNIVVQENITATVVELFISDCENSFYSINREFNIRQNGRLDYVKYQDIQDTNRFIYNSITTLEEKATINKTNFEFGDGINLSIYNTKLNNQESNYNIYGLVSLKNSANSSTIFNTIHNAKNTNSDIKYKHALHDKTKAVYEAKSIVNEKANNSKVFQASNTILLSDDATIFAKPHLEISIDELEAAHAATTGTLDKNQIHYLKTRGIPENVAFAILLKAFENEIFDTIINQKAKELILGFKRSDYV